MATRNRWWMAKLFGKAKSPFAASKPYRPKPRFLRLEYLESRTLLSGAPVVSLSRLLINMTPDPHPSGDQPADLGQEILLTNYTTNPLPPDPGVDPAITQFIAGLAQVQADIEGNPAARPGFGARPSLPPQINIACTWTTTAC